MIGPAAVRRVAGATGFREEVVEKVLYLTAILARFRTHPALLNAWALKGGTAINLFHLEVPRLSVDIDLNFIGGVDLQAMRAARPGFERAIEACCEREGCQVRRVPGEHAGGKYRLRYLGGVGGSGSLEVDVNFVQRVPLFGVEERRPGFPPGTDASAIPVLTLEELAAGKCAALLTRAAPRDAFDAWQLLELTADLLGPASPPTRACRPGGQCAGGPPERGTRPCAGDRKSRARRTAPPAPDRGAAVRGRSRAAREETDRGSPDSGFHPPHVAGAGTGLPGSPD